MAAADAPNLAELVAEDYATLIDRGSVRRVLPPSQWESWRSGIRKKCRQDRLKVGTYIDDPDLLGPRAVHAVLNEPGTNATVLLDGKIVRLAVPEGTPSHTILAEARRIIDAEDTP